MTGQQTPGRSIGATVGEAMAADVAVGAAVASLLYDGDPQAASATPPATRARDRIICFPMHSAFSREIPGP